MNEQNQDRAQSEGQGGIDRETELRNRENETGQSLGQQQPEGQQQPSPSGEAGQQWSETSTDQRQDDKSTEQASQSDAGFVGSQPDQSGDYLTRGEEGSEPTTGQDSSSGNADIESGESEVSDGQLDDGSDTAR